MEESITITTSNKDTIEFLQDLKKAIEDPRDSKDEKALLGWALSYTMDHIYDEMKEARKNDG